MSKTKPSPPYKVNESALGAIIELADVLQVLEDVESFGKNISVKIKIMDKIDILLDEI